MDPVQRISLPAVTADALEKIVLPTPVPSLEQFTRNPVLPDAYNGPEKELMILKLFLSWVPDLQARYRALEIPETVLWDSLKDITIWAEDYFQKHNAPGFVEWEWVANTFRMKVLRLGRLQFEPTRLGKNLSWEGRHYSAGTPVLEVHIPAGEPLGAADVAASMEMAPAFFRKYFGESYALMRCHSWLLCPRLKELLPENSRILQFQNLFTVYEEDDERQAEERVFGFLAEDARLYPEGTSLQRTMKQALLQGTPIGMGRGFLEIR